METTKNYLDQVKNSKENFYGLCYQFALKYVKSQRKAANITSEDVILAYKESGNPQPKEYRIFGTVMLALKKDKVISNNGFGFSKIPTSHKRPINIWKVN